MKPQKVAEENTHYLADKVRNVLEQSRGYKSPLPKRTIGSTSHRKKDSSGANKFKEELINTLKQTRKENAPDQETLQVVKKLQDQEKLTSEEFWRVYYAIRKDGPSVNYRKLNEW